MSKSKGAAVERELANVFDRNGFSVLRSPSSGSATKRAQPDVIARSASGRGWATEAKYSGSDKIYVGQDEVEALSTVATDFGVRPAVACRWKGDTNLYLFDPADAHRTGSGNYRFDHESAEANAAVVLRRSAGEGVPTTT